MFWERLTKEESDVYAGLLKKANLYIAWASTKEDERSPISPPVPSDAEWILMDYIAAKGWRQIDAIDLAIWNAGTGKEARDALDPIDAAAKYLCETVLHRAWDGTRSDGRAADGGFEPWNKSDWTFGINGNARQEDYRDVVREIVRRAIAGEEIVQCQ